MRFQHTVEIACPPDEVFAYLADPRNLPEWQSEVRDVHVESPDRFVEVRRLFGKEIESTLEVTVFEPGREYSLRALSGPVPFEVRHLLEPAGEEGTCVTVIGEADPGTLFRLSGGLLRRAAERQTAADFDRLKQLLESRSA